MSAAKIITFTPVDASAFNPDLGTIEAAILLRIDYDRGCYEWQACTPEGDLLAPYVFATFAPEGIDAAEIAADDHIRADIASKL